MPSASITSYFDANQGSNNLKWNTGEHILPNNDYHIALHQFKISVLNIEIINSINAIN